MAKRPRITGHEAQLGLHELIFWPSRLPKRASSIARSTGHHPGSHPWICRCNPGPRASPVTLATSPALTPGFVGAAGEDTVCRAGWAMRVHNCTSLTLKTTVALVALGCRGPFIIPGDRLVTTPRGYHGNPTCGFDGWSSDMLSLNPLCDGVQPGEVQRLSQPPCNALAANCLHGQSKVGGGEV